MSTTLTELPTYNGTFCRCAKCGLSRYNGTLYVVERHPRSAYIYTVGDVAIEHLRRTCANCGYIWPEAVVGDR